MQPIATDITRSMVCLSMCPCVGHMDELCKMAEPIKVLFGGGADSRGYKELYIRWGQDQMNPFATNLNSQVDCLVVMHLTSSYNQ